MVKISNLPSKPTAVAASDIVPIVSSGTTYSVNVGQLQASDWTQLVAPTPTITYLGNRSYSMVFTGVDLTGIVHPGTRLRTTRATAAPTRAASLNGTNQYFNRTTTINGMTFTDDFTVSAWVKLTSYGTSGGTIIASRYNGTSGWTLFLDQTTGVVVLMGLNGGASNVSYVKSYQSVPLNKWVHVTAQLDMSAFTATSTTSYVMIDGVDVPASVVRAGTNPIALIQAGNLEIGSWNGGGLAFPGKIAQVAIYSAKVTQANIRTIYAQGITPALISSLNIVSAYSFDNTTNDLNTTNANNLTAQNSASSTNADAPFGQQSSGLISSTIDYAITQKSTFAVDTTLIVQVPEGCTLTTTASGISAVYYSNTGKPYGMPMQRGKWEVVTQFTTNLTQAAAVANTWYNVTGANLSVPIGAWNVSYRGYHFNDNAASIIGYSNLSYTAAVITPISSRLSSVSYSTATGLISLHSGDDGVELSAATKVYANSMVSVTSSSTGWYSNNAHGGLYIKAENAHL